MPPLSRFLALGALAPVALVVVMVGQVPQSALTVPQVHVATAGGPVRLSPTALGATRTVDGLQVSAGRLDVALDDLSKRIARAPVPGGYRKTPDGIVLEQGVPGVELDQAKAKAMLVDALRSGNATLTLPVVDVPAPMQEKFAIVVRLSEFSLLLYEGTALKKRYPVGVGALKFPTPPGEYHIKSKAKNPTWNNPGSGWARSMPRSVAPGPKNPLGTRALRLDRGALVIHGTPTPSSVGRRSSHGCMRMVKADVEELYEIVPTGTPVFIIP